jgi:uncharacterized protein (UPF0548 family)
VVRARAGGCGSIPGVSASPARFRALADRQPTAPAPGATEPAAASWTAVAPGYRRSERTVRTGSGPEHWAAVRAAVLEWGVKTRSGFTVEPGTPGDARVRPGARWWLRARVGPVAVREPVAVVAVVDRPDRCGFAYATLAGHPVSGEEAFVVSRTGDGAVHLTLRSLTAPGRGPWRPVFPALLLAQRWYRRRYLRALVGLR